MRNISFLSLLMFLITDSGCRGKFKPQEYSKHIDSITTYANKVEAKGAGRRTFRIDSQTYEAAIFNLNGFRVAFLLTDETYSYTFKRLHGQWRIVDSFHLDVYPQDITLVDLNGDNNEDVRISYGVMRGNHKCNVLLWNKKTELLFRNAFFDKMNIGYDSFSRLVEVCALGGLTDNKKELYKLSGDSLIFYKGVQMESSFDTPFSVLWYYDSENGKPVLRQTVWDSSNRIWETFDSSLWSDYLGYFQRGQHL